MTPDAGAAANTTVPPEPPKTAKPATDPAPFRDGSETDKREPTTWIEIWFAATVTFDAALIAMPPIVAACGD